MINANDFYAQTDNEVLEKAFAAKQSDGIVIIPPRHSDIDPERNYWLIDRAILIPENTTVILQNATIKLSDNCRDNFFRSDNCGIGIDFPKRIHNIHIRGEGHCVLQGADHPRATGDGSKFLHAPCPHFPEDVLRLSDWVPEERRQPGKLDFGDIHRHSYGTDANKDGESHFGDWRGIGILLANVENFSISNLKIVESHGWGISLEECAYGKVEQIQFDSCMYKMIDGINMNLENQDGIDVRNGCHHIIISDITGNTGDDVVALTAVAGGEYHPGGALKTTHVMHNDWNKREQDIHDIIIRNIIAHSYLCFTVRLLPANGAAIHDVVIDGVIDTSSDYTTTAGTTGTILLGDCDVFGKVIPDRMKNITVSNIVCNSTEAVWVAGYLKDSIITNIINKNPNCPALKVDHEDGLCNVITNNLITRKEN